MPQLRGNEPILGLNTAAKDILQLGKMILRHGNVPLPGLHH
jgi:hypothetical protein